VPYRGQDAPTRITGDELAAIMALSHPYCRSYAVRKLYSPAVLQLVPYRHAGLGLEAYVQFTSPIRRYNDLLIHYQIKAALHARRADGASASPSLPFTAEALRDTIANDSTAAINRLQRSSERYWTYEYLRRRKTQRMEALVLGRVGRMGYRLLFPSVGLELTYDLPSREGDIQPGDTLDVGIVSADPRQGTLVLDVRQMATDDGCDNVTGDTEELADEYSDGEDEY